jgi:chromosome segregation ATPase
MKLNVGVNIGQRELNQLETERKGIQKDMEKLDTDMNFAVATNKYLNILEFEENIHQDKKTLENTKKEHKELFEQRDVLGQKLHSFLKREHDKIEKQYSDETKKRDVIRTDYDKYQRHIGKIEGKQEQKQKELSRIKTEIDELNKKEAKLQTEYLACPKITGGMILKDEIVATANRVTELNEKAEQLNDEIHQETNHLTKKESKYERIDYEIKHIKEKLELAKKSIFNFESQKNAVLKILTVRGFESLESCLKQIENERTETNKTVQNLEQEKERLELEITTIKEHGSPLNKDMKNALEWLRSEFGFAITGAEYLKDLAEDKQKEILNNAPWLTKSIILTRQDFNRIVNNPTSILPVSIMDSSVILTNHSSLQEQKKLSLGDIFVPSRDAEHYIKILDPETTIKRIEKEIEKIGPDINKYKDILGMADDDRDAIKLFVGKYPVEFEAAIQQEISSHIDSIEEHENELSVISKSIDDMQAILKLMDLEKGKIQDELRSLDERMVVFKEFDEVTNVLESLELSLKKCKSNIKELDGKYRLANDRKSRLEYDLNENESLVTGLRDRVIEIERELKPLESFAIVCIEDLQEEEFKNLQPEFDALNKVIDKVAVDASSLGKSIEQKKEFIDNLWEDIRRTKINKETLYLIPMNT